jgi:predicted ATPase/class 3 adenylate cyclase
MIRVMRELPSGTVTFLFTDIEGSTRLLHELGDAYAEALEEHRRALRAAFERHGGVEVDTQGDAFFVAFGRAKDAVAAAAEGRDALGAGPVRVRMGLHTGEPLLTEHGYVGIDVHRAARIAAVGHGSQILLSQSTRDLVGADGLHDLGQHRLKDLTAAERIYQLGEDAFPPLKSLSRGNLPVAATPLIGRDREVAELRGLLADGTRLVTVTGAGGSGKTRLAMQVAAELMDDFRDGAFFVPLAPVQNAELVRSTIAQFVGVAEPEDLREAEALLVLDNLEHLLPAAHDLSALLANAHGLKLLVTSRVRLQVTGEREFALEPFAQDEAIAFFLERARAVRRDVRLEPAIGDICRRLDGLPLALELAAARLKVLDPLPLLERLGQRLPVLTGGPRDAPERQRTLRSTIEWSYGLLESPLQQVFARLAVFAGSFSLDAAERVAAADLDDIAALVDWSLLKPVGDGRFLMLETIREYAGELLEQSDEADDVRDRNLLLCLSFVEQAEPHLTGPDQKAWYDRLALEQDNIREALAYACDSGDGERALMLAGTIWRFWWNRNAVDESTYWYERAFAVGGDISVKARGRAVFGAAHVAESRGDSEASRDEFEQAAKLLQEAGETRWQILALEHLAIALDEVGESERAEDVHDEALALAESTGDVRGVAVVNSNRGYAALVAGDHERAERLLKEALEGDRQVGDVFGIGLLQAILAMLAFRRGDRETAEANLRESLQLSSSIGDTHTLTGTLSIAAAVALARGKADAAARIAGAGEAACKAHGYSLGAVERVLLDEALKGARDTLGDDFERVYAAGTELDVAAAVELALGALE